MKAHWLACLSLTASLAVPSANAVELRLLSAGAVELGLTPALAFFQHDSGNTVRVSFSSSLSAMRRLAKAS